MQENTKYAFIGDIHSNVIELRKLLQKIKSLGDYKLVYLGDIFDSQLKDPAKNKPAEVLAEIQKDPSALVLKSNHQHKLERYLKGNALTNIDKGLSSTIKGLGLEDRNCWKAGALYTWLNSLPYCLELRSFGKTYRLAHAYCTGKEDLSSLNNKQKYSCLYGPVQNEIVEGKVITRRIRWWEEHRRQNFVRVAGHYHTVCTTPSAIVLDGNCGVRADGFLAAYLTDIRRVVTTAPEVEISSPAKDIFLYTARKRDVRPSRQ